MFPSYILERIKKKEHVGFRGKVVFLDKIRKEMKNRGMPPLREEEYVWNACLCEGLPSS